MTCKDCQNYIDCKNVSSLGDEGNEINENTPICRSFCQAESTDEEFVVKHQFMRNKTVRMPEDLIQRIKEVAERNEVPFNQLVIQCIEYALERLRR